MVILDVGRRELIVVVVRILVVVAPILRGIITIGRKVIGAQQLLVAAVVSSSAFDVTLRADCQRF